LNEVVYMKKKQKIKKDKPEPSGIYKGSEEPFPIYWKRLTPEQRNQYISMTADLILVDPNYLANPPKIILSRDEWIKNLQQVSDAILKIRT